MFQISGGEVPSRKGNLSAEQDQKGRKKHMEMGRQQQLP